MEGSAQKGDSGAGDRRDDDRHSHHRHHHHHHHRDRSHSRRSHSRHNDSDDRRPLPRRSGVSLWDKSIEDVAKLDPSTPLVMAARMATGEAAAPPKPHGLVVSHSVAYTGPVFMRKLYVGGIPATATEDTLKDVINAAMKSHGFSSFESPVLSVQLYLNKFFAFIEFSTPEEADSCMTLQNLDYYGSPLHFGRPREYVPPTKIAPDFVSPDSSDPTEAARARAAAVQQTVIANSAEMSAALADPNFISPIVEESAQKMYLGGLSASMTEDDVKKMLIEFGPLKSFELVHDPQTGNSKGFAFFEFRNPESIEKACSALHNTVRGSKTLTCQLAAIGSKRLGGIGVSANVPGLPFGIAPAPTGAGLMGLTEEQIEDPEPSTLLDLTVDISSVVGPMFKYHKMGRFSGISDAESTRGGARKPPTVKSVQDSLNVLVLCNMVSAEEVNEGPFYEDLLDDLREACSPFGHVMSIHVPRTRVRLLPGHHPMSVDLLGFGRVYVEFESERSAELAAQSIGGRYYNGRFVMAQRMPLDEYHEMVAENETRLRTEHEHYVEELKANITHAAEVAMPIESAQKQVLLLTGLETGTRNGVPLSITNKAHNETADRPAAAKRPRSEEFDVSGISLPSGLNPDFAPPQIPSLQDLESAKF